jgi:7-cyano-7-deazaguanine synthase
MSQRAVVLVSGGLDSATTLALAVNQGFTAYALSVDYGQRHQAELQAAQRVATDLGAAQHLTVKVDLRAIGGSALTADIAVPQDRPAEELASGIPITYVPARNTVFLSLALGYAETLNAFDIFVGVNAVDYSGYPDCRPAFIEQFAKLANVATKAAVEGQGTYRIHAPLIAMTKAQIIQTGVRLGVDYGLTLSCYSPDSQGRACGRCDSCQLRRQGFQDAGVPDPTRYVT